MKDGHLTLLVIPEDQRSVRRIRLSYRALRWLAALSMALAIALAAGLISYGRVVVRAGRTALLERENQRLEAQAAKVGRIVANLERSERSYQRIRSLAGLDALPPPAVAAAPVRGAAERPEPRDQAGPDREEGATPSGWPLAVKGFVTARFGEPQGHTGIDIAVPSETPVLVTAAGRVHQAGFDSILGHYVIVAHEGGLETLYGHNARVLVEPGQMVERAEAVAYSGSSGRSSAPHLHYEVRVAGRPVNPDRYLH